MELNAGDLEKAAGAKTRSPLADFFIRLVREKPLGTVGGIIVLLLLLTGIFADQLAPYRPPTFSVQITWAGICSAVSSMGLVSL